MATAGTLTYLISIDSSKLSKGLTNAESKVKGFGNKLNAMSVAAGMMIAKAATSTVKFVSGAINESMNFDKAMSQVAATLGKTTSEVKNLSDFARKMGAETAFTATEAAEALNYMALAGYDTEKSMKMLPTVLNLAAAGNIGLANASDMVTDAQSALGLSIEQTEELVDQMAKASSKTNTSVQQLGDAILTVGGTAKMMKGGTAELTQVLGVLADNGIKGSEGGTALRNVLLALSAPTKNASAELKKLGVQVFDTQGNMRDLPSIMDDLNEAMKDMTQEQRTNAINTIFNKRDLKSVEALLGTSKQRWKELAKEIGNASGAAEQMAETQLDNLAGDVTKLQSALGETKLAIIEGLTPAFRKLVKGGTAAVQRITDAFKKNGLTGAIKEAKKIFTDFVDNMADSENPTVRSLGKIAKLLTQGFNLENLQEALRGAGNLIQRFLLGNDYVEGASDNWEKIGKKISDGLTRAFGDNGFFTNILTTITDALPGIIDLAGDFVKGIVDWLTVNSDQIVGIITKIIDTVASNLTPIVESLLKVLTDEKTIKSLGNLGIKILESIFGKGSMTGLRHMLGLDESSTEPTKEEKERGETVRDYLDAMSIDDAVAEMKKWGTDEHGHLPWEVWDAIGNYKKYRNGEWGKSKEALNELDKILNDAETFAIPVELQPETSADDLAKEVGTVRLNAELALGGYRGFFTAKGNWDVPYDNYPALLHRGELVMNKSQARRYRDGEGGYSANDLGTAVAMAVDQAMSKVYVLLNGDRVGDLTTKRINKNINASSYSKLRAYGG